MSLSLRTNSSRSIVTVLVCKQRVHTISSVQTLCPMNWYAFLLPPLQGVATFGYDQTFAGSSGRHFCLPMSPSCGLDSQEKDYGSMIRPLLYPLVSHLLLASCGGKSTYDLREPQVSNSITHITLSRSIEHELTNLFGESTHRRTG